MSQAAPARARQGFGRRRVPTKGEAVAVSRGLDRDRIVDETGHQTVVFGRRGSRPFNASEMAAFYLRSAAAGPERAGQLYPVDDVAIQDGQLRTRAGENLSPPRPFPATLEPPVVVPASSRLFRRGK